jgi:hypothetical protein
VGGRPDQRPLGAGAVVAVDVDDEGVVELAHGLDGLDHAADLMIDVGHVGGEHVNLAEEQLLLVRDALVPVLEQVPRPWRQLGVLGNDAQLLLVREDSLADLVPAVVEQVHGADPVHPILRRVVRGVRAARHVVEEERLLGGERVHAGQVVDGVVGHRGREVMASYWYGLAQRFIAIESPRLLPDGLVHVLGPPLGAAKK